MPYPEASNRIGHTEVGQTYTTELKSSSSVILATCAHRSKKSPAEQEHQVVGSEEEVVYPIQEVAAGQVEVLVVLAEASHPPEAARQPTAVTLQGWQALVEQLLDSTT